MPSNLFINTYYIRVDADRLRIDALGQRPGFDDAASLAHEIRGPQRIVAVGRAAEALSDTPGIVVVRPFAHPRVAVDRYRAAERLMQYGMRSLQKSGGWRLLRPIAQAILHPLRPFPGGLSDVERRALIELAENAGARRVAIHEGRELSESEVSTYVFPVESHRP